MKKTSRKNLIALLCTFALGCANVEKSQAFFSIFGTKKSIDFINHDKTTLENFKKKWADGLSEIYRNFYEETTKIRGLKFEIINSEEFCDSDYQFNNPNSIVFGNNKNFNIIIDRDKLIVPSVKKNNMSKTLFSYFKDAGIIGGVSKQSGITSILNLVNKLQDDKKTFGEKIKELSYDQEIVFKNNYRFIKKDTILPTVPLPSPSDIMDPRKVNTPAFHTYGLEPLMCINPALGSSDTSYSFLYNICPGFLVVIYHGTKDDFSSFEIKMCCSKEINDLKKRLVFEYLKELSKLNPDFSIQELCADKDINFLGKVYLKKSKFDMISEANLLTLAKKIFKPEQKKEEEKEDFYDASEVAYQIWVENRGLFERTYRKSIKNLSNLYNISKRPAFMYGIYKSLDYIYAYIGRKILRGGEYTAEFLKSRNKLLNDPKKLKEAVSKMMKEGVIGLDSTIESLTNLVMGRVAMSKMKDVFNKTHCQLITFIGPPGTGKSLLANKFSLALTGKPLPTWGYFTSSSVRPGVPVVDQFFDGNSELVKRLKACNGKTVLFFDEIDKYDSKELLEKFRDAIDSGTMEVTSKEKVSEVDGFSGNKSYERFKTEKINISGLIVIFGTNEKSECWGLPPDDPNDPAENVGRTVVKRDGSMAQRFLKFKFHSFKKSDYQQMFENAFKSIMRDSKNIFGFEIVPEDNLLDKLAEESCYRMQGGRSIAVILNEMAGAITAFDLKKDTEKYETGIFSKIKRLVKTRKPKVQKVRVKFNSDTHKFEIEQVFDDTIPEVPEKKEEDNDEKDNKNADHLPPIPEVPEEDDDDNEENQGINNQQINNGIDNNVLNKQDEQQAVNSEPVEHQKDELENQKIENDKEFDNKSISTNLSNDQHESDQEEIASYDSDYENDKKPINLEDNREEIIAD